MAITAATRTEVNAAYDDVYQLEIMLRQVKDGSRSPADPGRFTAAEIDAQVEAVLVSVGAVDTAV